MIKKLFLLTSFVLLAGLFLSAAQAAPPPVRHDTNDPNLVGDWHLDETTGTTAEDSKGGDDNGTVSRTANFNTWSWGATGKFGTAITMNTSNTYADARITVPLTRMRAGGGSVAMWAKLEVHPTLLTTANRYFTGWQATTISSTRTCDRVQLYLNPVPNEPEKLNEICVGFGDQNQLDKYIKHMNIGEWYHLALTWNRTSVSPPGNGNYQLYVNGIDMPSGTMSTGYTPGTYKNVQAMGTNADIGNNYALQITPLIAKNEGLVGVLDEVGFYNDVLTRAQAVALAGADPNKAWNPTPEPNQQDIGRNPTLSWSAGAGASTHEVYFGTDSAAPASQGNTGAATTWAPTTLDFNKYYYWYIDEKDGGGNVTATGDLWWFRTVTGKAADPIPYDGAYNILIPCPNPQLNPLKVGWKSGDVGGISHDVYFGTGSASVSDANRTSDPDSVYKGNQVLATTTYIPAKIQLDKRYFWRIDEVQTYPTKYKGDVWTFTSNPIYYSDNFQTYVSDAALKNAWKGTGTENNNWVYLKTEGTDKSVMLYFDALTSPYYAGIKRSVPGIQTTSDRDYTFGGTGTTLRVSYKCADANTDQIYVKLWNGASSAKKVKTGVTEDNAWHEQWWKLSDFGTVATNVTAIEVGEGNDTVGSGTGNLYIDDYRIQATEYPTALPGDLNGDHVVDYKDIYVHTDGVPFYPGDKWLDPPVSLVKNGGMNKGPWGTKPADAQSGLPGSGNDPNIWPKYWYMWNDTASSESDYALRIDVTQGKPLPCAKIDLDMSTTKWNDGGLTQVIDVCDYNNQDVLISFMHEGDITGQDNTMFEYRPTLDGCSTPDTAGAPLFRRVQRGGGTTCGDCYGQLNWNWEPYTHVMAINVAKLDSRNRKSRYLHLHFRLCGRADSSSNNPPQFLKVDKVIIIPDPCLPPVDIFPQLPPGDITLDGKGEKSPDIAVDFYDTAIMAGNWLVTQPSIP